VLALAAPLDQAGHAQQREMVADRRLALAEQFTQRPNVQLVPLCQVVQDSQPSFVGEQFAQLHEILDQCVWHGKFFELGTTQRCS
jgi:hypothetical protein